MNWLKDELNKGEQKIEFHKSFDNKFPEAIAFINYFKECVEKLKSRNYYISNNSYFDDMGKRFRYDFKDKENRNDHREITITFELYKASSLRGKAILEEKKYETYYDEDSNYKGRYNTTQSYFELLYDPDTHTNQLNNDIVGKMLEWLCYQKYRYQDYNSLNKALQEKQKNQSDKSATGQVMLTLLVFGSAIGLWILSLSLEGWFFSFLIKALDIGVAAFILTRIFKKEPEKITKRFLLSLIVILSSLGLFTLSNNPGFRIFCVLYFIMGVLLTWGNSD